MAMKKFSLYEERYDQSSFAGRFCRMLDIVDPRTLFYTQDDVQDAVSLLRRFETSCDETKKKYNDSVLWEAKKIRDAIIHPDTKEVIPHPCRMSGFIPFNAPMCLGAIMATSTPWICFWHWANQTHNASINYFNRNASAQQMGTSTLVQSYVGAVTGAVSVAMGLKFAIEKHVHPPPRARLYMQFVALPATMTAAVINLFLMRRNELETGIVIQDMAGNDVGLSKKAAKKAMTEMTLSRIVLPIPSFATPPLGSLLLTKLLFSKNQKPSKMFSLVTNSALVVLGFSFGLPATTAIFPQTGTIQVNQLEPRFQNLRNSHGEKIQIFRYNKGL